MKKLFVGMFLLAFVSIPNTVGCGVLEEGVKGWGKYGYMSSWSYSKRVLQPVLKCYMSLSYLQKIYHEGVKSREDALNKIEELRMWIKICKKNCSKEIIKEWNIKGLEKDLGNKKKGLEEGTIIVEETNGETD